MSVCDNTSLTNASRQSRTHCRHLNSFRPSLPPSSPPSDSLRLRFSRALTNFRSIIIANRLSVSMFHVPGVETTSGCSWIWSVLRSASLSRRALSCVADWLVDNVASTRPSEVLSSSFILTTGAPTAPDFLPLSASSTNVSLRK